MSLEEHAVDTNEFHAPFERYNLSSPLDKKGLMDSLCWTELVAQITVDQDCDDTYEASFKSRLLSVRKAQICDAIKRFKRLLCPSSGCDAGERWSYLTPNRKSHQGYYVRYVDTAHSARLFMILGSRFNLTLQDVATLPSSAVEICSDDDDHHPSDIQPSRTRTIRVSIDLPEPLSKRRHLQTESRRSVDGDIHIHVYL